MFSRPFARVALSITLVTLFNAPGLSGTLQPAGNGSLAGSLLASRDYQWQSTAAHGIRLHFPRGTPAVLHQPALALAAARALARNLSLLGESWPDPSIDIFFFPDSRAIESIAGRSSNGYVRPGENTVLLVYDGRRPPVLQHELMHVVVNYVWGVAPASRDWLSEGIATWSVGGCQGSSFMALAAGLDRKAPLPSLAILARDFRKVDELRAYLEAASVVEFAVHRYGSRAVRAAWQDSSGSPHPLGRDGQIIESAWRQALRNMVPRQLDVARVQSAGCEPPVQ